MGSVYLEHRWVSRSERAAVAVLREAIERAGIAFTDRAEHATVHMIKMPAQRVWAGVCGQGPRPIDLGAHVTPLDLECRIFPALRAVTGPSHLSLYGVPIGVFHSNCLWLNESLHRRTGALPDRMEDWPVWLELARRHVPHPLGVCREPWGACLLFELVLLGLYGADLHRRAFGMGSPRALACDRLREALAFLGGLRRYVEDGVARPAWDELATDLLDGRCAVVTMGDWLYNEFGGDGRLPTGIVRRPVPGTGMHYLYNVDYLVPVQRPGRAVDHGTLARLAALLLEPELQGDFCRAKGALPAVRDAAGATIDADGWRMLHLSLLDSDILLPSMSFEQQAPCARRNAIAAAIRQFFFEDGSLQQAADRIARCALIDAHCHGEPGPTAGAAGRRTGHASRPPPLSVAPSRRPS